MQYYTKASVRMRNLHEVYVTHAPIEAQTQDLSPRKAAPYHWS